MILSKWSFCLSIVCAIFVSCSSSSTDQQNSNVQENNSRALIIYGADGTVTSYDIDDKKVNWTYKNPGEVENRDNTFTIENDLIYVPFSKGNVTVLNARNGTVKWSKQLISARDLINSKLEDTSYVINGQSAAISKDRIYLSARNSQLYALNKEDGNNLWKTPLKGPYTNYPPLFIGDFGYTNNQEVLYKFDQKNGSIVWETGFKKHPLNAKPASDGTLIYSSDGIKELYATDQDSKLKWKFISPYPDGLSYDKLLTGENTVYMVGGNLKTNTTAIVAVNTANGTKKWESVFNNQMITYFQNIGGKIYAYTDQVFFVLDEKTGVQEFSADFPSFEQAGQETAISNIVQIDPKTVIYQSNNGIVSFDMESRSFSIDYEIRAPKSSFPRNVTWIEMLGAK
ncbi:outer membrane protein assembly factor BamB family protein [Pedobacter caeni]|uniref:Outer membrane protein assembly factor BamB, contains PQQ-like beta-propeller repeat n=1 Tax=Pedobacter caeni TaxID=288992 RepID=A0A1M5AUD1_9SPHI|nr:PQQ-binding-like beta-propeller repeat protein [Pedobacter caeni]SHF33552.1 Outer membrane protein assembly factor BamB, contains PQQ-like beta-propeller repeat [Pedobacter caeni]